MWGTVQSALYLSTHVRKKCESFEMNKRILKEWKWDSMRILVLRRPDKEIRISLWQKRPQLNMREKSFGYEAEQALDKFWGDWVSNRPLAQGSSLDTREPGEGQRDWQTESRLVGAPTLQESQHPAPTPGATVRSLPGHRSRVLSQETWWNPLKELARGKEAGLKKSISADSPLLCLTSFSTTLCLL